MNPSKYIFFSTADWDAPYWTNKQHMAKQFAQDGSLVLFIESVGIRAPKLYSSKDLFRIIRRFKNALHGCLQVQNGVWVLSPLNVPVKHGSKIIKYINRWIVNYSLSKFLRKNGWAKSEVIIWTYHPYVIDYLNVKEFNLLIYHCVDNISAIPGVDSNAYSVKELDLIKSSDFIFTTNINLHDKFSIINPRTYNFCNVVDAEHFYKCMDLKCGDEYLNHIPHPRIVYSGVLTDLKVDFPLLLRLAKDQPTWQLIFIGEEREGQASRIVANLRKMRNVHFPGYKEYKLLPGYLKIMDIGIIPALKNSYTISMSPMKMLEYIASGLPVVANQLKIDWQYNRINSCDNYEDFVLSIKKQLLLGKIDLNSRREIIGEKTWIGRKKSMMEIIKIDKNINNN